MRTRLMRRVVSLFAVFMTVALVAAPAVAADTNVAPTVVATVSNANPVEPQTVVASATFTDPESATETYTCTIDYGDGTAPVAGVVSGMTCTGPEHRYLVTGSYFPVVTVTDSGGASGAYMRGVNYTNEAPVIGTLALVGPQEIGQAVHIVAPFLDNGSAFEAYTCSIDYGDGSPAQAGTYVPMSSEGLPECMGPDHVYQGAARYTISVAVTDSGGASNTAQMIASFSPDLSPVLTAPADQTVSSLQAAGYGGLYPYSLGSFLDPSGAAGGPWQWTVEWGDGTSGNGTAASQGSLSALHRYLPGTYRAHVVVKNASGWSSAADFNVTVAGDLVVAFGSPNGTATEGIAAPISVYYYDPYPPFVSGPFAIHVDFGDGTSQDIATSGTTIPSLTHIYHAADPTPPGAPGTLYTATATVTDSLGHTGAASYQIGVYDVAPVVLSSPISISTVFHDQITLASFLDASVGPWHVVIDGGQGFQQQLDMQSPGAIQVPYQGSFGSRTFTVTVWDRGGLHTTVTVQVTVVNLSPVVTEVHFTPSPAVEGTDVAIVATYSEPRNGDYLHTCSVDYGDGSGSQAGSIVGSQCYGPVHLYSGLGPYTASVSVYSNVGVGTGQATLTLPNDPPVITTYSIPASTTVYQAVFVTATFGDRGIGTSETYMCTVDAGDGSGPEHPGLHGSTCQTYIGYGDPGTYTVTIRITDSNGGVATQSAQISVYFTAPVVNEISVPATVNAGVPIAASATFVPTGRDETYTCTVNYDDGAGPQPGVIVGTTCQGPTHVYTQSGFPEVAIIVTGSVSGQGWNLADIVVYQDAPSVNLIYAPGPINEGASTSALVYFSPTGRDETYTCTIDYGDGTGPQVVPIDDYAMSCQGPDHPYANAGTFTITVKVTASGGSSGSATQSIVVVNVAPYVTAYSLYTYGPSGEDASASVIFTDPGFGAAGSTETYACAIDYGDGGGPKAGVIAGNICTGPHHSYASKGFYVFVATVTDSHGAVGTYATTIEIYNPRPIVGAVSAPATVIRGSSMTASAEFVSTGLVPDDICSIDYGDGTGAVAGTVIGTTCQGPAHVYAASGTFQITVTVTSAVGSTDSASKSIKVCNPAPTVGVVSAPGSAMVGTAVTASAPYVPTGLVPADTCTVDYGDGTGALAATANGTTCTGPSHKYTATGTFTITVKILAGNGFTASSSATIQVYSLQVGAVSVIGPLTEGASVTASASFTPVGTQTYKCKVDYGDGSGGQTGTISGTTCKGPSHKYGRPGSFTVTVTVTGSKGNLGSSSKTIEIANVMPVVTAAMPSTAKVGSSVSLSASFTDPGTTETYQVVVDWGDGVTTPIQLGACGRSFSASHTYTTPGDYGVQVYVSDDQMAHVASAPLVIAIYDPARTLTGSGTFASPAGACSLSSKCAVASTATFAVSASYPKGATKPTAAFTFSATGISFTATSFDWYVVTGGVGMLQGSGKVNGVSGYRFCVFALDGTPDSIIVSIYDSNGNSVYYNNNYTALKTGTIVLK